MSEQRAHRYGPLHQTNKPHKDGKHHRTSSLRTRSSACIKTKSIGASRPSENLKRTDRLRQALQLRKLKYEKVLEEKRKLGSDSYPPLLVGVIDLHLNSTGQFIERIKTFGDEKMFDVLQLNTSTVHVKANRFKTRFTMVALDTTKFDECIDIVKGIDLLIILHRAELVDNDPKRSTSLLLRAIRVHCLPTIINVFETKENELSVKDLNYAKRSFRSIVAEDEKYHILEKDSDLLQLFHLLGNCKLQPSLFKDARSQVLSEKVHVVNNKLAIVGFVRRKILSPNDSVHLVGYGDYKISQIEILPDPVAFKSQALEGDITFHTLVPNPIRNVHDVDIDDTYEDIMETETTDQFEHIEMPELDELENCSLKSDDEFTNIDGDDDEEAIDEYNSDMDVDSEKKELDKLKACRQDSMFPDEIDTPLDKLARVRFARYTSLKKVTTNNFPEDYNKIVQFKNFQSTKRRVINILPEEGANPGQYVRIHLEDVPEETIAQLQHRYSPLLLVSLLSYEKEMTVTNIVFKCLTDVDLNEPIKSKDELLFYVGFRKFKACPIFSNHCASSKFKYERYLKQEQTMVATLYAPVTFPPAPVLIFKENFDGTRKNLIASGSVLNSDSNRLVIKRVRLAGHPFKIHSKVAVIRFMFFNNEDVLYFKPVELVTRYGRRGHISEPIGTHGHMKCIFDKKIRSDDCVFMNLYKRQYPKWTYKPIVHQNNN